MSAASEFHYRLHAPVSGYRPGSHPSSNLGTGQDFAAHARLLDTADPRRLDIRASLRNVRREWLVKQYRQRAAVGVYAVVDVSASMQFGERRPKLHLVADFAESLGFSAFRAGDPAGLLAFDNAEREDLYVPARYSRGVGVLMGSLLRGCTSRVGRNVGAGTGLAATVRKLAGKKALVFLVSDFHWALDDLQAALDVLVQASVVPMVVWDRAETSPPPADGLLTARDAESGARRTVWMSAAMRHDWHERVANRRREIRAVFASRGMRPYFPQDTFDPEDLSRYFLEEST